MDSEDGELFIKVCLGPAQHDLGQKQVLTFLSNSLALSAPTKRPWPTPYSSSVGSLAIDRPKAPVPLQFPNLRPFQIDLPHRPLPRAPLPPLFRLVPSVSLPKMLTRRG